jgi:hypothetical protein
MVSQLGLYIPSYRSLYRKRWIFGHTTDGSLGCICILYNIALLRKFTAIAVSSTAYKLSMHIVVKVLNVAYKLIRSHASSTLGSWE